MLPQLLKLMCYALLSLSSYAAIANSTDNLLNSWTRLYINNADRADQALKHWIELENRIVGNRENDIIVKGAIGYQYNAKIIVWLGYLWVPEFIHQFDTLVQEHRLWQHVTWNVRQQGNMRIIADSQLEQRKDNAHSQWAIRFRQKLQVLFPNPFNRAITPLIFDEIFFNFNNPAWINQQFLNQNRVFVGVQMPVSDYATLELGYLNRYELLADKNRLSHAIRLSLLINA